MSSTPWREDTARLLETSIGMTVRAQVLTAAGVPVLDLDLEGASVGFDETRAPRVLATLLAVAPLEQEALDALDPRRGTRVRIWAGYARPDDVLDEHLFVDLLLRRRTVNRPADTVTLECAGTEAAVLEQSALGFVVGSATSGVESVKTIVQKGLGYAPSWAVTLPDWVPSVQPQVEVDDKLWPPADALSETQGGDLYDDGLRVWHLEPRPVLRAPALELVVGARGTLLTSDTALDREDFANAVLLVHTWRKATVTASGISYDYFSVNGRAAVTSGPYAAVEGNRRTYRLERDLGVTYFEGKALITTAEANRAAAALLGRGLSRGRALGLSAIAALWARPGQTAAVTLPTGPRELHILAAVQFDLLAGRMTLATRRPDTDATITQGA